MKPQIFLIILILAAETAAIPSSRASSGTAPGPTWSGPTPVTSGPDADFLPYLLQGNNGTVWLFWELWNVTTRNSDVYYKTSNGTAWSPAYRLTSDLGQDAAPAAAQVSNGTIFMAWSSNRTGNFEIFLKKYDGHMWSGDLQLTHYQGNDLSPSLVALRDGSLWVFWKRETTNGEDIFLRKYEQNVWSADIPVTTDPAADVSPSAIQLKDGRVVLTWARTVSPTEQQIFYKTFTQGVPSAEVQFTQKNWDGAPQPVQDRNGTIWVFWARKFSYTLSGVSGLSYQDEVMYTVSSDNALSWSSIVRLTNDPTGFEKNDSDPAVIQGSDRRIWLALSADPQITLPPPNNETSFSWWDIYLYQSSEILAHDLAITKVASGPGLTDLGQMETSNITVANLGDFPETANVSLYANTTLITSQNIALGAGTYSSLKFNWNTSRAGGGHFVVRGVVAPAPGETLPNQGDNILTGNLITIKPPGDTNGDGRIDIVDAATVAAAFGSRPGAVNWNPAADINKDDVVNIIDMSTVAFYFGFKL